MRETVLGIVAALLLSPELAFAQAGKISVMGIDLSRARVQEEMRKALAELKPGVAVSDHIVELRDMGTYNVAIAVVARPAGANLSQYLSHDKITEIYYVLKGSGTQATGTMVNGLRAQPVLPVIGPGMTGSTPLQNPHTSTLRAGDIQIVPPGVGHGFTSIEPGGIQYVIFRVDPEKVLGRQ